MRRQAGDASVARPSRLNVTAEVVGELALRCCLGVGRLVVLVLVGLWQPVAFTARVIEAWLEQLADLLTRCV